jgi:hypothetical protein
MKSVSYRYLRTCLSVTAIAGLLAGGIACSAKPTGPVVDNKTQALCAAACKSASVCFGLPQSGLAPMKDRPGCEKQCAVEVDGRGYLSKDVANLVMKSLADAEPSGGDKDCKLGLGMMQFDGDNYRKIISDPAYIEKCADGYVAACGGDTNARNGWLSDCFTQQYVFNTTVRIKYDECLKISDCNIHADCRGRAVLSRPKCSEWFGPDGFNCVQ